MPDGFNMVTAMETIHRHIHAVGCGALPSCWMTGDPSFFCRADGLFVPSLAVWFGAACRDAAVAGSMAAGVRRQCDFGISRYVPDEVEPLVSVHVRLSKRARYMELARAVCGTVRGAGLRKGASAQAVQDAWHR